ncbi:unnamed protein product [Callosobruchus maculatus]|uniref:Gustatory receptor n=1 Tax=Callosobruchus maculatus TaxID=64391 RepID=A0A653CKC4_CALMS|nr:unnamed protein product [Callosobruchus maculatus]
MSVALLLKLCKWLVIAPGEYYRPRSIYTVYIYFWRFLSVASASFYVFGVLTDPSFEGLIFSVRILDSISIALITASTLCTTWKCALATNILQHLQLYDAKENSRGVTLGLVLVHFIFIATKIAGDASLSMSIGLLPGAKIVQYYIFRDIQWYMQTIAVFLVTIIASKFKMMFEELNASLQNPANKNDRVPDPILIARKRYNQLADLVDEFNDVFGTTILFSVLFTMAMAVLSIHKAIVFTLFIENDPGKLWIILASTFWTIVVTLQALVLAGCCSAMDKEALKTEKICYSLLNDASVRFKKNTEDVYISELSILAQLINCRRPSVSAAGFFKVNFEMMGFIATTVTSDTIVTLQCLIESTKM